MPSLPIRAVNLFFAPLEMMFATIMFAKYYRLRKMWWLYLAAGLAVIVGACFLLPWLKNIILAGVDDSNFSFQSFGITCLLTAIINLILVVLYGVVLYAVFDTDRANVVYITCASFLISNMAGGLYNIFLIFRNPEEQAVISSLANPVNIVVYILIYAATFLTSYFVFVRKYSADESDLIKKISIPLVCIILINLLLGSINAPRMNEWATAVYGFLTFGRFCLCAIGLVMQFLILNWYKMKFSQSMLQHIMEQQREQYRLAQESIDNVNVNAHDLRKQIDIILKAIRDTGKTDAVENELAGMIESIAILDTSYRTGNRALDVTLTEKARACLKNKIKLSVIADGNSLAFMSDIDIYTLFGNALDNAIEATEKIEEEDGRIISFSVRSASGVISVHIENTFNRTPTFVGGIPQTIKNDKRMHGFGVKSMDNIAKKYDGNLSVKAENGIFYLDVIFPVK